MAITQTMCTSFKAEVMLGVHNFRNVGGNTFKIALYTSSADINANTASYTSSYEATGTNYVAGGATLTNLGVVASATSAYAGVGYTDFNDVTWANSTITARGALIYNTTPSANGVANTPLTNPAVCALDFGTNKTSTAGNFTIIFPVPTGTTAIIRIA